MGSFKDIVCTGVVRCLSKVYASEFVGKLTGTADKAKTLEGLTSTVAELNYVDGVTSNIQTQIDNLKKSVSDGKTSVAGAITGKGVSTAADATHATMATNIGKIVTLSGGTADATAAAGDILSGKTGYVKGAKITGTMTDNVAKTILLNCGESYYIPAGYHNGGGKVTANSLSNQTSATAKNYMIGNGLTGYVSGSKITGTLGTKGTVDGTKLIRSTPTALSVARQQLAGASVGGYALFAGGRNSNSGTYYSAVDAYNTSLTRSTPTQLGSVKYGLAGASVGNYALFAGGSGNSASYSTVDAYNRSLTRSIPTALSVARYVLAGASVGYYALFAGGINTNLQSTVDAYNTSLTRSTPTALSVARFQLGGASVGNYALFAGGYNPGPGTSYSTVDAYNTSLTRSTPTALSVARYVLAGASVGNYALFAGGSGSSTSYSTVDAYNTSLTRSTPTSLGNARSSLAGASVGNYALFAGGYGSSTFYSTVDAYSLETFPSITIPETTFIYENSTWYKKQ